jgi:hypothetical protein
MFVLSCFVCCIDWAMPCPLFLIFTNLNKRQETVIIFFEKLLVKKFTAVNFVIALAPIIYPQPVQLVRQFLNGLTNLWWRGKRYMADSIKYLWASKITLQNGIFLLGIVNYQKFHSCKKFTLTKRVKWGTTTPKMAVPVPGISWYVLLTLVVFSQRTKRASF